MVGTHRADPPHVDGYATALTGWLPETTIVTRNLNCPEWDQAFATNRLLASATLDRLRHNAY